MDDLLFQNLVYFHKRPTPFEIQKLMNFHGYTSKRNQVNESEELQVIQRVLELKQKENKVVKESMYLPTFYKMVYFHERAVLF